MASAERSSLVPDVSGARDPVDRMNVSRIAYEASVRALASQETQLAGLHARASFLLAAAGIATGAVLGTTGGMINRSGLIAIIFFAVTACLATWILRPRREAWVFTSSASIVLDTADAYSLTEEHVLRWVGNVNQEHYMKNKAKLNGLYTLLSAGCSVLVLAIVAAVVSLAG